jgi:protein-histidine pros-kinase
MGLKAKFNLVMLLAFLVGLALAAVLSWQIVHENARREVVQQAAVMMAQASAIRDYTAKEIGPLLAGQIKVRFLPHTVPSWAAQTNLRALAAQFPDYTYKEAALNPTNPADRATDWESGIIAEFARDPSLTSFTSTRDSPTGPILSISRPIRITDKDCLTCHSTPSAARPR